MTGDDLYMKRLILGRFLIAIVVVLLALLGSRSISTVPFLVLGGAAALLSLACFVWSGAGGSSIALLRVQIAADVLLVTLLAYYSGGLESPLKLFYFLPVIVASSRLGSRAGGTAAAGAVLGCLVLAFTDFTGWAEMLRAGAVEQIATLVVSFLLVAMIVGFLETRARKSEEQLRDTRADLDLALFQTENIVESLPSGLALIDSDGRLVYLNRAGAAILGIPDADGAAKDYRIVFADVPAFCDRVAAALDAGRPESRAEFFVRRRNGGSLPVGVSTSILRDGSGEERGVIAIFQDLTDARRLEERLRHDDRMTALGEFAAGLAHEIRNPLNAIRGSVDLLRESVEDEGDNRKLIDLVSRESERLGNLVQDVLQYGRMESGERESTRLAPIIHEVSLIARNHPSYRNEIEFTTEVPENVEGTVNAEQIKRVLLNLTINAFEAVEGPGSVCISVVVRDDFASRGLEGAPDCDVAIVTEDSGVGIPADRRAEVFQPFKTSKKQGTGLGLAIVDKIVQSHGGRITVASEAGRGSRFVVYIPA